MEKIKAGTWFSAVIEDELCIGQIQVQNGMYYLCQDIVQGQECTDKFGFEYSWNTGTGLDIKKLIGADVFYFKTYKRKPTNLKPSRFKIKRLSTLIFDYEVVAVPRIGLSIGCSFFILKDIKAFMRELEKVKKILSKYDNENLSRNIKMSDGRSRSIDIYKTGISYEERLIVPFSVVNKLVKLVDKK